MATLKPGNPERGWNDPPMFSYNVESTSQKSPRRNLLNKRVGHDLTALTSKQTGTQKVLTGAPSPSGPPLMGPTAAPPPSLSDSITTTEIKEEPSKLETSVSDGTQISDIQEDCLLKFKEGLTRIEKLVPTKVSEDITRKLAILSEMWEKNKLSLPVQRKTLELATALSRSNCDEAHEIHIALMVDHVSEVSQWMVGIKRLIQETRKLPQPEPDVNKESGDAGNSLQDSREGND